MTYKPGQSGNPGGRTKEQRERERKLSEAIRGLGGEDGAVYVRKLHDLAMDCGDPKAEIAALKELLDRGWGKAPDTIQVEGQTVDPLVAAVVEGLKLSPHERRKRLAEIEEDEPAPVVDDDFDDS